MKKFESEVRALQTALEQAQTTLTSPELGRLSLKEQLSHRQVLCTYQFCVLFKANVKTDMHFPISELKT